VGWDWVKAPEFELDSDVDGFVRDGVWFPGRDHPSSPGWFPVVDDGDE
jgi:hypothetical protein